MLVEHVLRRVVAHVRAAAIQGRIAVRAERAVEREQIVADIGAGGGVENVAGALDEPSVDEIAVEEEDPRHVPYADVGVPGHLEHVYDVERQSVPSVPTSACTMVFAVLSDFSLARRREAMALTSARMH